MQSLSLEAKINMSLTRIRGWYEEFWGEVYVSFSGGKDSTVLLDLVRRWYPSVEAVLPVKDLAADNCVLFLWATYPMLKEALKVIEAWGFKYKSIGFQWVKQNRSGNGYFFGLGRWTRGNTEPCLIAVKGKPQRASNSVSQLIFAPLRAHSQKPDITRDKIRELMGGDQSYIELFARNTAPGWDVWGNEVNKYGN